MTTVKELLPNEQAITITLNSLASSTTAGRESTAVDNSTDLYLDALVTLAIGWASASAAASGKLVTIFAHGSTDGSTYSEALTGSDAAYTIRGAAGALIPTFRPIGFIVPDATTVTTVKRYGPWNVAAAFGGVMPRKWGLVVQNDTNVAFAAAACTAQFEGIQGQF